MKFAVVPRSELISRWDAEHVIECSQRGGAHKAHLFLLAVRNKKGTGLLDLVDRAKEVLCFT